MEQSLEKSQEITRMLQEWSGGKQEALDALLPLRLCGTAPASLALPAPRTT